MLYAITIEPLNTIVFAAERPEDNPWEVHEGVAPRCRTPLWHLDGRSRFTREDLIGTCNNMIAHTDRIAFEFDIFGDHKADLVIGDSQNHEYCFVEFEDATETSSFKKSSKATPGWSARFERGFSQIIDWILWLDNQRGTTAYTTRFGVPSIQFVALLVIGRDRFLEQAPLRDRLTWRSEQTIVASRKVNCLTYDRPYCQLATRLKVFSHSKDRKE